MELVGFEPTSKRGHIPLSTCLFADCKVLIYRIFSAVYNLVALIVQGCELTYIFSDSLSDRDSRSAASKSILPEL